MKLPPRIVFLAVAFEGSLAIVAVGLATWQAIPLTPKLAFTSSSLIRSAAGVAPLIAMLVYAMRSRWRPLVELRELVSRLVGELFRDASWFDLAAVSVAAGVGEELVFRGALQPLAERWFGSLAGLILVSLLFGALHSASRMYFLLAAAVGLYLGWLAQHFDDLAAPIVIHGAYDFAALLVLTNFPRRSRIESLGP